MKRSSIEFFEEQHEQHNDEHEQRPKDTIKLAALTYKTSQTTIPLEMHAPESAKGSFSRGKAILLFFFLLIVIVNATNLGSSQFIGAHGWAFVLSGSSATSDSNLLRDVADQLRHTSARIGTQTNRKVSPEEYINTIVQKMTLDEKIGQMMIVQFTAHGSIK